MLSSAPAPLGGHDVVCRWPRGSAGDSGAEPAAADRLWNSPPLLTPPTGVSLLQSPLEQLGVRKSSWGRSGECGAS